MGWPATSRAATDLLAGDLQDPLSLLQSLTKPVVLPSTIAEGDQSRMEQGTPGPLCEAPGRAPEDAQPLPRPQLIGPSHFVRVGGAEQVGTTKSLFDSLTQHFGLNGRSRSEARVRLVESGLDQERLSTEGERQLAAHHGSVELEQSQPQPAPLGGVANDLIVKGPSRPAA